jgi:hypothetical protein
MTRDDIPQEPHIGPPAESTAHNSSINKPCLANDDPLLSAPRRPAAMRRLITVKADEKNKSTNPSKWDTGDIVYVPHMVPSLDPLLQPSKKVELHDSEIAGSVVIKSRPAIVVAACVSNLITLPIFSGGSSNENKTDKEKGRKLLPPDNQVTTVTVEAASSKAMDHDYSQRLFVTHGGWKPKPEAYVQLTNFYTAEYIWPMHKSGQLEYESICQLKRYVQEVVNISIQQPADRHLDL